MNLPQLFQPLHLGSRTQICQTQAKALRCVCKLWPSLSWGNCNARNIFVLSCAAKCHSRSQKAFCKPWIKLMFSLHCNTDSQEQPRREAKPKHCSALSFVHVFWEIQFHSFNLQIHKWTFAEDSDDFILFPNFLLISQTWLSGWEKSKEEQTAKARKTTFLPSLHIESICVPQNHGFAHKIVSLFLHLLLVFVCPLVCLHPPFPSHCHFSCVFWLMVAIFLERLWTAFWRLQNSSILVLVHVFLNEDEEQWLLTPEGSELPPSSSTGICLKKQTGHKFSSVWRTVETVQDQQTYWFVANARMTLACLQIWEVKTQRTQPEHSSQMRVSLQTQVECRKPRDSRTSSNNMAEPCWEWCTGDASEINNEEFIKILMLLRYLEWFWSSSPEGFGKKDNNQFENSFTLRWTL